MEIKPIHMMINAGRGDGDDAADPLNEHFRRASDAIGRGHRERYTGVPGSGDAITLLAIVGDFLAVMSRLDQEYGAQGQLPIDNSAQAVDEALRALAELENWLGRLSLTDQLSSLQAVELGIGYWAMRHDIAISAVGPIVNALAAQSNAATSKQETAAIYAMMQGFIHHFSPLHRADLERSDPQRPWRLLNLNFAITAIRSGDPDLMRYAFDTLNAHLPLDLAGFYGEAQTLAAQPGFPAVTRGLIDAEIARWTRVH